MKHLLTILLLCTFTCYTHAQKLPKNFDAADFDKKAAVAEWLYQYDKVAWVTSDSAMAQDKKDIERLGKEWFCFEGENGMWHAVYGKYENDQFKLVFHFTCDTLGQVRRSYAPLNTVKLDLHARALQTAANQLAARKDSASMRMRFNQYIRRNADKTFTVWLLPAFQPSGIAVYGGEFIYTIDPSGNPVIKDDSYFQGEFLGFKVGKPREFHMLYTELEKPTLGSIFFVWYYKQYFTRIVIENKKTTTTAMQVVDGSDHWSWVHLVQD